MSKNAEKLSEATEMVENQFQNISNSLLEIQDNVKTSSKKIAEDSMEFVKKYPLHTAVGAGVVGFLSGYAYKKFGKK